MATEHNDEQNFESAEAITADLEMSADQEITEESEILWFLDANCREEPTGNLPDWQEVYEFTTRCVQNSAALRSDIDDVVQYAIKKLYSKNLTVRHWKAYVRMIVFNRVIDLYRERKVANESRQGLPGPGEPAWQTARTIFSAPISVIKPQDLSNQLASDSVIAHVLSEVPEGHRELFIDYLEGVPLEYLAQIYGYASARSVSQTISRLKNNLRTRFGSERELFSEFDDEFMENI